jgi:methyl-accepting chemotaxis protein
MNYKGTVGWFGRSRTSLTFRLSVILGATLLVISVSSAYIGSILEQRTLLKAAENEVDRLASLLAVNAANPLFTFNQSNLNALVQAFSSDSSIRFLELKDPSGKVIAGKGDAKNQTGLIVKGRPAKVGNEVVGSVSLGMSTESVDQSMRDKWQIIIGREAALFLVLACALLYLLRKQVTKPLGEMNDILKRAEESGDLGTRFQLNRKDEIGELAQWFNVFMDKLRGMMVEVASAAHNVTAASQQLSSASDQLSTGSQEQASSLEETAASLEEITGTVKQNADNARQANQLAVGARDTAEQGGSVVSSAVEAMGEINKSSKKIADIITTIDEIAFQTNLLALNAAVEAARAGEQGRGFAVVAAEVRNLAQRSATAAKEIKGLIQDSVGKVETGSELVNKSGQTLQAIVSAVKKVTDIIGEIAAASQEQSSGIDQVNKAVSRMDHVVQSNAAQTEEMSSTARSLSDQARELQGLVARFKLQQNGALAAAANADISAAERKPARKPVSAKKGPVKSETHAHGVNATAAHPAASGPNGAQSGFEEF